MTTVGLSVEMTLLLSILKKVSDFWNKNVYIVQFNKKCEQSILHTEYIKEDKNTSVNQTLQK